MAQAPAQAITGGPLPPELDDAQRRLRRAYLLLLLLLGLPVLAASSYLLALRFELAWAANQRQLAMGADRRVARLDGLLSAVQVDLLRLRDTAREPVAAREIDADVRALQPTPDGSALTLDSLPALLRDVAPQVILTGSDWPAPARLAALTRAARFAEQARLTMTREGGFKRVMLIDTQAGELWVYPWQSSEHLLAEAKLAHLKSLPDVLYLRSLGESAHPGAGDSELRWHRWADTDGRQTLSVTVGVASESRPGVMVGELAASALDNSRVASGIGRFWVLDEHGQTVLDHMAREQADNPVMGAEPMRLSAADLERAARSAVAEQMGSALLAARRSGVAPWTAVYAADSARVRAMVLEEMSPTAAAGLALMALFVAVGTLLWRRFGKPSLQLVDYLRRLSADAGAPEPRVPTAWEPWMHLTRDTFAGWRAATAREARSEALKAAIIDHALAAVVTTDEDGRIVDFNPAAEQMFGRERAATIGLSVADVMIPERHREAHTAGMARMSRGGEPRIMGRRVEMAALRADASEFPVEMVLWRTLVDGRPFYTASMFDLTDRRVSQAEIERQREALRQSEKLTAMGSLLAGVAHELNNPLAIVMGRASLLQSRCEDARLGEHGVALRDDAQRIHDAAERCGRIVRTFLNMARQRPAQRGAVPLNDLARAAVDLLNYSLRSGGIEVSWALDPALPLVDADADRVGQVVLNLLVNAQQALAVHDVATAGPRRIRIDSWHDDQQVHLRVSDNGPGVRTDLQPRIFDAFFTTKAEGAGTGLGLSVARGVAQEHGGSLTMAAESPLGGASFVLSLPRGNPAAPAGTGTVAQSSSAPMRVLVVDDEAELADMMRDVLEAGGFEVATAESGAVALEILREGRFDAIVSDLRMPDVDGAALWREVAASWPALAQRMVFITGDTLSPAAVEFIALSGCSALEKPFRPPELLARVREMAGPAINETDTGPTPKHG